VVSTGVLSAADYWGEDALTVSSVIHNTMKGSFRNVLIVPGGKNFFVASDRPLRIDVARMVEERGLDTLYVNQYYIEDASLKERSDNIMDNLDREAALNRDFLPVAYYVQLRYWLSQYRLSYWAVALPGLAILAVAALRMNTVSFGLFTGGFAAASMELVLIIAFQVIYGYVFHMTGLIVAAFMGGLAAGSLYAPRLRPFRADMSGYAMSQFAVGLYCAALPFALLLLKSAASHYYLIHAAFFLVTFGIAALVGAEFSLAARLKKGGYASVASELYGVDLLGSALGALWVTTYLLPLLGIINVSFIVASLSFVSGANSLLRRKRLEAASV
jgi:spermidine synthase